MPAKALGVVVERIEQKAKWIPANQFYIAAELAAALSLDIKQGLQASLTYRDAERWSYADQPD